ncbi:TRAP transporter substrate-binding protein [Mesorhizobium sp. 1B3]|uniref:TRAP transporter substrate-binding protein n=1 Tax=Mesorhizobium sp. 1B3 TaxID=3243599 RepID=UPI003D95307E
MLAKIFGTTAVIALMGAASIGNAQESSGSGDLKERLSVAKAWLDGTLDNYGDHTITYDGEPITIRATSHIPDLSESAVFGKQAYRVLEAMSGGKIIVQDRWGGTVHGVKEGLEANRSGITDMAACFSNLNASSFPLTQALALPGIFPNEAVMAAVASQLAEEYFRPEFERYGVYIGYIAGSAPFSIFSKKPITKLEDLAGLKVRTGSGLQQEIYEALGATPVSMGSGDLYSALQRGLIDVVTTSIAAAHTFRVNEVASDFTYTPINVAPLEYCMNPRTYEALPPDLQKVVYDWNQQMAQVFTQLRFIGASEEAREQFIDEGVNYHEIDSEEWTRWQAKFEPVVEAYIEQGEKDGLPMRELVAKMRELSRKYSELTLNELLQETIESPAIGVSPVASN